MATEIWTIEDLDNIRLDLSGDYILMRNLDFNDDASYADPLNKPTYTTGAGWTPIGIVAPFTGKFNGDNYTISNLYIHIYTSHRALFGITSPSTIIQKIGLINVSITGCRDEVAALVTYNYGIIIECSSSGVVSGRYQIGGLIATNNGVSANVSKCYSSVVVTGEGRAGGLIAYNYKGDVSECYATGNVSASHYTGGFIGTNSSSGANISNCYSTGNVTRLLYNYTAFGGFIGNIDGGIITDCYSIGAVIYTGAPNPTDRGFVGLFSGGSGDESVWDMETSGQTSSQGAFATGKTTAQMQTITTYKSVLINWDIATISNWVNEIWILDEGKAYPVLSWRYPPPSAPRDKVLSTHKNKNTLAGDSRWF